MIIFQVENKLLNPNSFNKLLLISLNQPSQKTSPGCGKMLIGLRRVKSLACIKRIKHIRRLEKLCSLLCNLKKTTNQWDKSRVMGTSGWKERKKWWSCLMAQVYSKMRIPAFIWLKLCKSGPGNTRLYFHTGIGHQSPDLNPTENLYNVLEKALRSRLHHHQCKILMKNWCNTEWK